MSDGSNRIHAMLQTAFQPSALHIDDESWKHAEHAGAKEHGGGHFVVHITATCFDGLPRTKSHRMIFKALDTLFPDTIHALSIKLG